MPKDKGQQFEPLPTSDEYPTVASSENFEVWEDSEDGVYIISFVLNGVTIAVERELLEEFANVIDEAAKYNRSRRAL